MFERYRNMFHKPAIKIIIRYYYCFYMLCCKNRLQCRRGDLRYEKRFLSVLTQQWFLKYNKSPFRVHFGFNFYSAGIVLFLYGITSNANTAGRYLLAIIMRVSEKIIIIAYRRCTNDSFLRLLRFDQNTRSVLSTKYRLKSTC